MDKIANWEVTRSGALMTVNGIDANGRPAKVTNVARIKRTEGGTVAEKRDGFMVELI